jgi:branched-chain amino acid aminotransferase
MQNAIINVNGEIVPGDQAQVSVYDRGFLYGDSLYEVARTYDGKYFGLDEHLARLTQSAALCHIRLDQGSAQLRAEMERTAEAFRRQPGRASTDVYARLIVTRGRGKIGFSQSCVLTPTQYVIIAQPVDAPTPAQYSKGCALQVAERLRLDRRALDPAMKSGNYLNSVLAYLEAAQDGFDDALLCNADGHVTEGTTFNIYYIKRGILVTPPLDIGILDGITRRFVLAAATQLAIPYREVRFPRERLYEADEAFLTGSVKEVFPVTRIDDVTLGQGRPGPLTDRLHAAYQALLPNAKKTEKK